MCYIKWHNKCYNSLMWLVMVGRELVVSPCEDNSSLTTTHHMGELWSLLCHFIWHNTYFINFRINLVPQKVAQKKSQLSHMTGYSWWRGVPPPPPTNHNLPHEQVVAFSVIVYVALKGLNFLYRITHVIQWSLPC